MADLNKIIEDLSSLTVVEAAELSKQLEEKWGVTAAAAVAAAPAAAGAEETGAGGAEGTEAGTRGAAAAGARRPARDAGRRLGAAVAGRRRRDLRRAVGEAHGPEERVKMTRLRLTIAKRLKESQDSAAMLTTFNEVDMNDVMQMRQDYQEDFQKKYSVKLGFMSFFVKSSVVALKNFPAVNAEIEKNHIIYKN